MPPAVRFDRYGGIDVLDVVDVPNPQPGAGEVLVRVEATSINPGESKIRDGALDEIFPATFPSGEGSDLAGVVEAVGDGVAGLSVGHEVLGFTDTRASHAEFVAVDAGNLTAKPAGVSWDAAGSLFVAGTTAYACVRAVELAPENTVVVSGAAGGVGTVTVQLAVRAGATVIGLASGGNHEWLRAHGVTPVSYGDGVADRITAAAPHGVDAFIDLVGGDYVELAVQLGVAAERINTIVNFAAVQSHGIKAEGSATAATAEVLAGLADLIDQGFLEIPIAATYPLAQVQDAYRELEQGHTRGKIVLHPSS